MSFEKVSDCELCEAARFTPWHHEDDVCWVADCEVCDVPMVVWNWHGAEPPAQCLVQQMGGRMIGADRAAAFVVDHEFERGVDLASIPQDGDHLAIGTDRPPRRYRIAHQAPDDSAEPGGIHPATDDELLDRVLSVDRGIGAGAPGGRDIDPQAGQVLLERLAVRRGGPCGQEWSTDAAAMQSLSRQGIAAS